MSLILEALRKSEAERRRGEAPDLRVELPPPAPPKRRNPPVAWLAGAALLAVLAVVAFWPRSDMHDGGPPSAADDAVASTNPAAADSPTVPADAGFPRVERIQAPDAAPAPEPAPDRPLAPPPMAVRAAEEAAAARGGAEVQAHGPGPATDTPGGHAAGTVAATGDDALRITGLSPGQRERLPALKLSLHMWNDDPARRFAVIDGQRRIEGDRLGDATITAIDRDGVLLDLDGEAVRVPLP